MSGVDEVFRKLNYVLQDIKATGDSNKLLFSSCDIIQKVQDSAAALRSASNREKITEIDLEEVIGVTQRLVSNVTTASETESHNCSSGKEPHSGNTKNLLTELLRLLRNACAACSRNQLIVSRQKRFISQLADVVITSFNSNDPEDLILSRCLVQFANNAVVGCPSNSIFFWEAFFPIFRLVISGSSDASLKQCISGLLFNCLIVDSRQNFSQQLVSTDSGLQTLLAVITYLHDNDCDFALYIIEKCVSWDHSAERLWLLLSKSQRNLLLEVAASRLKQHIDVDDMNAGSLSCSQSNVVFFAEQFVSVCEQLSCMLLNRCANDEQQQELGVVRQLLECLCLATTSVSAFRILRDHRQLLQSSLDLLKSLHSIGSSSVNPLTVASKPSRDIDLTNDSLVYGVKSDVIRLIGNLVYQHQPNQDLVRELSGIPLILEHTNIDGKNPFIVQWSVLAIRNLCESNLRNQQFIAALNYQGLAPDTLKPV